MIFLTERVCLENGHVIYFRDLERLNTLHSWSYKYDFISVLSILWIKFQTPVIHSWLKRILALLKCSFARHSPVRCLNHDCFPTLCLLLQERFNTERLKANILVQLSFLVFIISTIQYVVCTVYFKV